MISASVALSAQENFLNYLLDQVQRYDDFEMLFGAAVIKLSEDNGSITGVVAKQGSTAITIRSDLVVAADGRFSKIRKMAGFSAVAQAPPMDVAWIRLPRKPEDVEDIGAFNIASGRLCILLARPAEWQLGYVFPKGDFNEIRKAGIDAFRKGLVDVVPWLEGRVEAIQDFSDVHLLSVKSDRLDRWYKKGLLFIGDSAHVMSPVGGVGINYAINDAVEAANVLLGPLLENSVNTDHLAEVQRRRLKPTRTIQRIQGMMQRNIVVRALKNQEFDLPLIARVA